MTADQFQRVEALFNQVKGLSADERSSLIAAEKLDADVSAKLLGMLVEHDEKVKLDLFDGETVTAGPRDSELIGTPIGPYKLLEKIGEGAFGDVYMADQREPVRRLVALKILKPGMDSRAVIARFKQERQALAMMDHPNIAKVFDAGTTPTGRPYFVMELVKGEPITTYCNENKLTISERLDLFAQVCHAVQHAHQKAVIHRDLKPNNILVSTVDGRPQARVIDFGIAKALGHRLIDMTEPTGFHQAIGTLEYMSPEQAGSSLDIDTRADVYSLGVVLYELLTGERPFQLHAAVREEAFRIIREEEPAKPSTRLSRVSATLPKLAALRKIEPHRLGKLVRGDLDWIVLMCLEKDRKRRYETAVGLADDIRRHLVGEPVFAAPPSTRYKIQKYVSRNRVAVVAVSAVVASILAGLGGTVWQARKAKEKAAIAMQAEAEQRRLASSESLSRKTAEEKTIEAEDAAGRASKAAEAARTAEAEQRRLALSESAARHEAEQKSALAESRRVEAETARDAEVKARKTIENNSYVANIEMATEKLNSCQFDRMRAHLAACPPRLRNWEWQWLNANADNSLTELHGHTGAILSVSISPDGSRAVTGSADKTARVWDLASGKCIFELTGHSGEVTSANFSPDGSQIVTASSKDWLSMWDAATGKRLFEVSDYLGLGPDFWGDDPLYPTTAVFSPDGSRIVAVNSEIGRAQVWDSHSGKRLGASACAFKLDSHRDRLVSGAFSSDGRRIVTASNDATALVWDSATGNSLFELKGHSGPVTAANFSPDGRRIVTASEDATAHVWDSTTGHSLFELKGHSGPVTAANFSPDGSRIATASEDATARVWDSATGVNLAVLKGQRSGLTAGFFSPDGMRIVTASQDSTLHVWDLTASMNWTEPTIHMKRYYLEGGPLSPDCTRIIRRLEDNVLRVCDTASGRICAELKGHSAVVQGAAFSTDGKLVVTGSDDDTARVWDAATGRNLLVLKGHTRRVVSANFSPDGTRIVTASDDKTARLWDMGTGVSLAELKGHTDWVDFAVFSPDGKILITTSWDSTVRVWEVSSGALLSVLVGHSGPVFSASFSPDGQQIVTASADKTARVWRLEGGMSVAEISGHADWVNSAVFSPDGTWIVTASSDQTAQLWDAVTGKRLIEFRGHASKVKSANFSSDGTRIVTASEDNAARVWDAVTGRCLVELKGHGSGADLAVFTPDGTRIITSSSGGIARVWDSVPFRIRYAEQIRKERGENNVNFGVIFQKELRGEAPATWLSDPSLENARPHLPDHATSKPTSRSS